MKQSKTILQNNLILLIISMLFSSIMAISSVLSHDVMAADISSCIASSGASNVASIHNACNLCFSSPSLRRGALWINNNPSDKNTDTIVVDSLNPNEISIYLWGQIYGCGNSNKAAMNAYSVWIGQAGQMATNGLRATYISVPKTLSRPGTSGKYTWSIQAGHSVGILNLQEFINAPGTTREPFGENGAIYTNTVSINRCPRNMAYVNTTNTQSGSCYGDPATIRVQVTNDNTTETPDNPGPEKPDIPFIPPGNDGDGTTAEFYSTSTVHVDKTADVMDAAGNALEVSSGKDGTAKVKFSTDASSVTVKFWHNLFYTSNFDSESDRVTGTPRTGWRSTTTTGVGGESKTGTWSVTAKRDDGSDVYNEIDDTLWRKQMCNEWRFYQKELKRKEKDEANGDEPDENNPYQLGFESYEYDIDWATVCDRSTADKPDDYEEEPDDDSGDGGNSEALKKATEGQKVGEVSINVTLYPGQTVTVCRTIDYKSKTVNFKLTNGNNDKRKYDKYKLTGYGDDTGQSSACAEITRPEDPYGDAMSTGTADSTIMFAGEDADISWNTYATSYPTRRLSEWQALAYRTPVRYNFDNIDISGTLYSSNRYRGTPCAYLSPKMHHDYCKIIGNRSGYLNYGASETEHQYEEEEDVIVPDTVGAKYCNTFAYKHEYWYAYDNGENEYWFKIPRLDYWNIFDSACRTIAKKPSTSIWNGSLLTNGGITTSLSYRFDHARMGRVNEGQARQLYGSWSEFLDVVNGNVSGLASGSTLANGSGRDRRNLCSDILSTSNSPLTIANSNCGELGGSGIRSNSAFRVRLRTYLENQATPIGDTLGEMNNVTGTNILKRTGNLNITGDIILANGPYSDIYHIPQVIIFVEGDVNISSNVTRLDAWIIATGTINTCPEFEVPHDTEDDYNYGTESDAENRLRDTCTKQLVFNGPVMAKNLILRRSFGSDNLIARWGTYGWRSDKQSSAEVFNLRMDNYLWAYAQAGRYDSSYTESYSRELAPRY